MPQNEGLSAFRDMLQNCYSLWSWRLSASLDVLETTCLNRILHSSLLLSPERVEAIKSHQKASHMPLILGDPMGVVWSVVFSVEGQAHTAEAYVLGPVYTGNVSSQTTLHLLESLNLSLEKKWQLIDCLSYVPTLSTVTFFQLTVMLHYYVCGEVIKISDFSYFNPGIPESYRQGNSGGQEKMQRPHAPHITEKTLMDMVRTGNLEYHEALSFAGSVSPGIRTKSSDPIRQAKYSVVAFITLCTRAAIEGGLSTECAYTLSDTYTESVDNCNTISEIAAVSHTMYDDFIHRVNRCRNSNGISRPVQACCDYIDTHPMAELSVDELAEKAGYTAYYFSRVFKRETGKAIKEYIRDTRIRQAKTLLSTTNLSIQEISEQLHFCSQSYFAGQFQKMEGISPADYRYKNKNR